MKALFFLGGLVAIGWLAFWTAMDGRTPSSGKKRWSPFEWREDVPVAEPGTAPRGVGRGGARRRLEGKQRRDAGRRGR